MKYFYALIIIFLFSCLYAEKTVAYNYFPSNWPKHEKIKNEDEYLEEKYAPLGENPIHNLKDVKVYRVSSDKGIVSIFIKKDKSCDIKFHASQKEHFFGTADVPPYITYSMKNVKNCEKKINTKDIRDLLYYNSISLFSGFFKEVLASYNTGEMLDQYGDYHYLVTVYYVQKKTITKFVTQVEEFFKKNGIDVNKKPEKFNKKKKK